MVALIIPGDSHQLSRYTLECLIGESIHEVQVPAQSQLTEAVGAMGRRGRQDSLQWEMLSL